MWWFLFISFTLLILLSGVLGYMLGQEVVKDMPHNIERRLTLYQFPMASVFCVVVLPYLASRCGVYIGGWGGWILFALLGTVLVVVVAGTLVDYKGVDCSKQMGRSLAFMTLIFTSFALCFALLQKEVKADLFEMVGGSYEFYGPSRITSLVRDDDNNDGDNGQSYKYGRNTQLSIQWKCSHVADTCQVDLDFDCRTNDDDWHQQMYDVQVQNVEEDGSTSPCHSLSQLQGSGQYGKYVSPTKDGSPYVSVFANCTSGCSAVYSNPFLDKHVHMVRPSQIACGIFIAFAIVSGLVWLHLHFSTRTSISELEKNSKKEELMNSAIEAEEAPAATEAAKK